MYTYHNVKRDYFLLLFISAGYSSVKTFTIVNREEDHITYLETFEEYVIEANPHPEIGEFIAY